MLFFHKKVCFFFLAAFVLIVFFFSNALYRKGNHSVTASSLLDSIVALVTINPMKIDVSLFPTKVIKGADIAINAKITNKGNKKIENVKAKIFLPDEFILLRNDNSIKNIGAIPAKSVKEVSWNVIGIRSGNYIIAVSATGNLSENLIASEDSAMVKIIRFPRNLPWEWIQDIFDFFRERFSQNDYLRLFI